MPEPSFLTSSLLPTSVSSLCPQCGGAVPADGCWCPQCGAAARVACGACGKALPEHAHFCTHCGASTAAMPCPQCSAEVWGWQAHCVRCGTQARPVCAACHRLLLSDWSHCPACGGPASAPREAASSEEAEAANLAGVRAYDRGDYREAVRRFRQAVELDRENASFWTNLGVAYGELDDDLQAFAAYRRAVELHPDEVSAYLNMGYLYNEREQTAEAREMWETVVRLAPDSAEAAEARRNLRFLDQV